MGITHPFPEPESPDLERFAIYSRSDIVALMRRLRDEQLAVTLWLDGTGAFVVSTLADVNPSFEELVFAPLDDTLAQRRLLNSKAITLVAFADAVKIQWSAARAEAVMHEGRPSFRVRLPQEVLRLQRRSYFRVTTPSDRPAICLVPWPGHPTQYEALRIQDISVGGMALVSVPEGFSLPEGTVDHCYLDLPGIGQVTVGLKVRHVEATVDEPARYGCEFLALGTQGYALLQRYVNRLDAEQRRAQVKAAG